MADGALAGPHRLAERQSAHFVVLTDLARRHFRLVEVATGAVILERNTDVPDHISVRFSANGAYVSVRVGSVVEIVDPVARRSIHAYNLAHNFGRAAEVRARRGEVYYVERTHALASFNHNDVPTTKALWPHGIFRRHPFPRPPWADGTMDGSDSFGADGLVSPSEQMVIRHPRVSARQRRRHDRRRV